MNKMRWYQIKYNYTNLLGVFGLRRWVRVGTCRATLPWSSTASSSPTTPATEPPSDAAGRVSRCFDSSTLYRERRWSAETTFVEIETHIEMLYLLVLVPIGNIEMWSPWDASPYLYFVTGFMKNDSKIVLVLAAKLKSQFFFFFH